MSKCDVMAVVVETMVNAEKIRIINERIKTRHELPLNNSLVRDFWNCGDAMTVDYAVQRAKLNRNELEVLHCMLDDCLSQEETAEKLEKSTRGIQEIWRSAASKLLGIPWVKAYAKELRKKVQTVP